MRAIGYREPLPATDERCLVETDLPDRQPGPRDLLVEVRAVSVNPVDTKVRRSAAPGPGGFAVLGWDAVGVVAAVGEDVTLFSPGDRVYYAGDLTRPGTNSEMHLVDERIAARAPASLSDERAAALPLTSITAWELLFDRLQVVRGETPLDASLLIVGAAGGVGSILTQLAARLTGLTVVGTASRAASVEWVRQMGADEVVDHSAGLTDQVAALDIPPITYVASLTHTDQHFDELAAIVAPQGRVALIDDPAQSPDVGLLKRKSASLHWEFMFTRSMYRTPDMRAQHDLLTEVAGLVDAGELRTTLGEVLGTIDAPTLRRAHALIESGSTIGKLVLAGW
jgi:zinc-binding alcohol dehydrogenase family protein